MSPRVSVIVPIYCCEPYVRECLRSLVGQTMGDFEALCVSDASPDDSLAVSREAVSGDDRFRFIELPENRGLSASRNAGMEVAQGDILVFLDSDDYLSVEALEHIVTRFDEQNLDDLYFNARSFHDDERAAQLMAEDFSHRPNFEGVATGRELFVFFEAAGQFHPQAALRAVRRSFVDERGIRFREGILHEDLLFTFQTLCASRRSSFLNEPIYQRRLRVGSITGVARHSMRNIEGHLAYTDYARRWTVDHAEELDDDFVAAVARHVNRCLDLCAQWYADEVDEADARRYLGERTARERARFEFDVAQRSSSVREILESRTYRAGEAVTALPRLIRKAFKR